MSKHTLMISAALVGLMTASPALAKSELYQITPVQGSSSTNIFGVNDSGIATGSWLDSSGTEHGYIGPPDGSNYTTFDDPNQAGPGTEPRGISDDGLACGFGDSSSGSTSSYDTWERSAKGKITPVTKGSTVLNYFCQGFNGSDEFAGSYVNSNLQVLGYLGKSSKYTTGLKLKGIKNTGVAGRGVDNAGDVVGWYYDTNGVQNGFLIMGGKASTIDVKGANLTVLEGINNKGQISGQYQDTSGVTHGFVYTIKTGKFKEIKVQGAVSFVQTWGINDMGQVAVGSDAGYFIYCPSSKNCTFPGKAGSAKPAAQRPQLKPHPLLP